MFSKLHSFVAPFFRSENFARGAALQERADLFRLFLLAKANETWPKVTVTTLEQIRELAPTLKDQRNAVLEHVQRRSLTHFERWYEERPPPLDPLDPEKPLSEERRAEVEAEYAAQVYEAQKRAFGFALRVGPSKAGPKSGRGVFVDGKVAPGSVIAFYPGVWYEPVHLFEIRGGTKHFEGNDYLMARFDKVIIDGSQKAVALVPPDAVANPLSVANLVNHPPEGRQPNVVPAALNIDTQIAPELVGLLG